MRNVFEVRLKTFIGSLIVGMVVGGFVVFLFHYYPDMDSYTAFDAAWNSKESIFKWSLGYAFFVLIIDDQPYIPKKKKK